jgi:hypothetical protein
MIFIKQAIFVKSVNYLFKRRSPDCGGGPAFRLWALLEPCLRAVYGKYLKITSRNFYPLF